MKRKILFVLLAIALVATISAQEEERVERHFRFRPPAPETVTVSGTMIVANGRPALKSGDVTYLVGGITRLVGFVDGLKEGAQVTINGLAMTNPRDETTKFIITSALTIDGRTYELSPLGFANMMPLRGGPGPHAPRRPQGPEQPPSPRQRRL